MRKEPQKSIAVASGPMLHPEKLNLRTPHLRRELPLYQKADSYSELAVIGITFVSFLRISWAFSIPFGLGISSSTRKISRVCGALDGCTPYLSP